VVKGVKECARPPGPKHDSPNHLAAPARPRTRPRHVTVGERDVTVGGHSVTVGEHSVTVGEPSVTVGGGSSAAHRVRRGGAEVDGGRSMA
jgi:hypothetical protein